MLLIQVTFFISSFFIIYSFVFFFTFFPLNNLVKQFNILIKGDVKLFIQFKYYYYSEISRINIRTKVIIF